jgi:hypothetical protein
MELRVVPRWGQSGAPPSSVLPRYCARALTTVAVFSKTGLDTDGLDGRAPVAGRPTRASVATVGLRRPWQFR